MQARADWHRGEQARAGQSRLRRSRADQGAEQSCLARGPACCATIELFRSCAALRRFAQRKVFFVTTPKLGIPVDVEVLPVTIGRQLLGRPLPSAQESALPFLTR